MDRSRQLAHEIQSPLLSLEIRLRKLTTDRQPQALASECLDEVVHLRQWLTSFLELDTPHLECGEMALDPLLHRIERRFEPIATESGVELHMPIHAPHARGHQSATERVVSNLVDNAIKFSCSGGAVRVRVRADAMLVTVEVEDDGPGIPEEAQARIFDPFYRGHEDSGGMGIGLAISKRLARAQNGDLVVASEPGRGSAFTLTLPAS